MDEDHQKDTDATPGAPDFGLDAAAWGRARHLSNPEAATCPTVEIFLAMDALRTRVRGALEGTGETADALLAEAMVIDDAIAAQSSTIAQALRSTLDNILIMMAKLPTTSSVETIVRQEAKSTGPRQTPTKKRPPERDRERREAIRIQNEAARQAHKNDAGNSRSAWFRAAVEERKTAVRRSSQGGTNIPEGKLRDDIARKSRKNRNR